MSSLLSIFQELNLTVILIIVLFEQLDCQWTLICDSSDLFIALQNIYVTSKVMPTKAISKQYRGQHTFISESIVIKC